MKLDERLSLCAQMVRDGAAVADIGTDHAYLPVYLVECGKIHKAIAADVREGPLENAKGNISKNGFDQQIKTVLSDGLEKILEMIDKGVFIPYKKSLIKMLFEMKGSIGAHRKKRTPYS